MHTPTYLNRHDMPLPNPDDESTHYVVADNGVFLERRSAAFSASIQVDASKLGLASYDEYCRLTCGRILRGVHQQMLSFFKRAHALHGGEAALVLLHHPQRKKFRWYCPPQVIDIYLTSSGWTAGSVIEYENPLTLPDGYVHFGDAHLHVGSPKPSSIDINDDQDGLHIIVNTIQSSPTYNVDFVIDGRRFHVQPAMIFEDPDCTAADPPPPSWLDQIRIRSTVNNISQIHTLSELH